MWFLFDVNSKERLSEGFSSQAKLAKFMGHNPKTLNKAINDGRNRFQFRGKEVFAVEEVTHFSVHDSPTGPPLKEFKTEAEMAKWIGVTRPAVHAAFQRTGWCESWKIRKNGKDFFMKRILEKEPVSERSGEAIKPTKQTVGASRLKGGGVQSKASENPTISLKSRAMPVRISSSTSTKIYPSVSAATTDLGIDARTIHDALKSGRNSFTRRKDRMKFKVEKASLQPKETLPQPPDLVGQKALDDLEKIWKQIVLTMKNRYPGWEVTLSPDLEKFQTKRVLFNPKTGSSWPVTCWKDYLDYFDTRYLDYPYEKDFVNYFAEGVWKFSARISPTEFEPWFRFILQGQEKSIQMETPAANREKHTRAVEAEMAWKEENEDMLSPEEKEEDEWEKNGEDMSPPLRKEELELTKKMKEKWEKKENRRMALLDSERNPFHPDIWKRCEIAPMDPEFAFNNNMHKILPQGFRVKGRGEEGSDKMQFMVVTEKFDRCVAPGPTVASLEIGFPFPPPPPEILGANLDLPIWPLDVREDVGEVWWRVQIVPR